MSVRPSVRAQKLCTLKLKIIECGIETAKISTKTHEDLRSWSRMKFFTTLLYLGNRLMKSIQTFFILKEESNTKTDWTRSHPISEVGAE